MCTPRKALRNKHLNCVQQLSTPLKIPASPFLRTLGHGTGVNVYRLDRSPKCGQPRSPWAVKRVTSRTRAFGNEEIFNTRIQNEAKILRKLQHPNIVGFRAVSKDDEGVDSLALECCNTSLASILEERHDENFGPLPSKYCKRMIIDIAKALDYLHTEAKILHGDLKSGNILVKGEFEICKLCDFGVSLPLDENGEVNFNENPKLQYIGTDLWSAPEIMDESDVIDCKADIFSFGLIIYETIALVPPHTLEIDFDLNEKNEADKDESCLDESKENAPMNDSTASSELSYLCEKEAACGTRPPLPQAFLLTDDYSPIVEIFGCCTNDLAEDRPPAKVLWECLEALEKGK